ncbi:DUF4352 domain-containing protein [Halobacteriales archaeon Cl-PHB]
MRRREYLATVFASTGLLAGCSEGEEPEPVGDGGADTSTPAGDGEGDDTVTPEADDTSTPEPRQVDAVLGEVIEGDNLSLVVESVERNADLGEYTEPDKGNEFVSTVVAVKNTSDEFASVSSFLQIKLHDDEGYSYDQTFFGGSQPTFNGGQMAPGEVDRGAVNFEIPSDASGLTLRFDFSVSVIGGIQRATIDMTESTDITKLQQDLKVDAYDIEQAVEYRDTQVTVNSMRTTSSLGDYTEADPGNEYLILDISIMNGTDEDQRVSTALQAYLKDGNGWSHQADWAGTAQLDRPFEQTSPIAPGETRRGEVVYQVEKGLSPLYWVFEFSLWTEGNKTFWQLR